MPAVKLYISVDIPPPNILPSTVRTTTTINASTGPRRYNVSNEKMFDRPIFAPGKNSGGNRLSTMNMISPIAHNTDNVAMRLALKYLVFVLSDGIGLFLFWGDVVVFRVRCLFV